MTFIGSGLYDFEGAVALMKCGGPYFRDTENIRKEQETNYYTRIAKPDRKCERTETGRERSKNGYRG